MAACLLLAGAVAHAQSPWLALRPQMQRSHIPHVAIAVFTHAQPRLYFCSLQAPPPLGTDTIFEAASLSKPVFAAFILALVNQGQLDLDRPLSTYLSQPYSHRINAFDAESPQESVIDPRLAQLTARMVLDHTSGLPNWSRKQPLTLIASPGSRWGYSAEAYIYLQHVVETITHQPLAALVQSVIFAPLGMTHSSFIWKPDFAATALDGHDASLHSMPIDHYKQAVASSTLYTTLADYSRFLSAMLDSTSGSSFAHEQVPQVIVNETLHLSWALGVAVETTTGSIFHWGANPGFQSMFFLTPRTGNGFVFLTDSDNGLDLVDRAAALYAPGRHPALRFPMLHPKD